ncbi:MAG: DUF4442 domain-containing protein [Chitinophagales bacterium]|nr:DUF4442 domain-containing protein [Chitinophagales bacterium]
MYPREEVEAFFDKKKIKSFQKMVLNPVLFKAGLVRDLPLAAMTGVKFNQLTETNTEFSVEYKYINKNPFGTTYWAVLGMIAEMASGAMLLMYTHKLKPSVSTFVVSMEAKFVKRAVGVTYFRCDQGLEIAEKVYHACKTMEAVEIPCKTNGYNEKGEVVAEFQFIWGIKARKSK